MKRNPLSPAPPIPHGRLHRLGDTYVMKLRELFGDLGSEFDDLHRGVFFSEHPIVCYAYAFARRQVAENEYGLNDVVDPPVLIGIARPDDERVDTDALLTAYHLLEQATQLEDEEDDDWDRYSDFCRSEYYDLSDLPGLSGVGGDIGNRPDRGRFISAVRDMRNLLEEEGLLEEPLEDLPPHVREEAIRVAASIVPQSRLLRPVEAEEVCEIRVIAPFASEEIDTDFGPLVVDPSDSLESSSELDKFAIHQFDKFILQNSQAVYSSGHCTPQLWHGTSLTIARKAFPELVTMQVFHEGIKAGSSYDLERLEQEYDGDE